MSGRIHLDATAAVSRRFGAGDVAEFVALGGARPVPGQVPEPLIGAMFSYLLGMRLPGRGTNYLKQETRFLAAAPLDQTLHARVRITRVRTDKQLVDLRTTCETADGTRICAGRALVLVRDVEHQPESI